MTSTVVVTLALLFSAAVAGPSGAPTSPVHETQNDLARLQADAAAGDPAAMYQLGLRFQQGKGVRKNADEAVMWFHRAAAEGQADAMLQLGMLHESEGRGVANDNSKAALWYGKAAKLGQGSAMFYLGTLYSDGRGVRRDMVEAYKWLDLAAIYAGSEDERKRAAASRDSLGRSRAMSADRVAEAKAQSVEWQRTFGPRATSVARRD
jgi:TPR repeat protein